MHPIVRVAMVGQQQQPDGDLRHDQRLGQREAVRYQGASAAASPAIRHERRHRGEQADGYHQECQRVMHR
jgi:hypothetical protein